MAIRENEEELAPTYRAADLVRNRALRSLDSPFTPGRPVWDAANAKMLHDRFVANPDTSTDSFETKLERQLTGAPDEAVQLMAELLFIHLLMAADIKAETKRRNVTTVLSWMDSPVEIPPELDAGLEHGFASAGMGFRTRRPVQISYLIEFVVAWVGMDDEARMRLLDDPWAFKDFVYGVDVQGSPESQRNALLYLVHPATFEDIVSQYHKREIAAAWPDLSVDNSDIDRVLLGIRNALEEESGDRVSFYSEPYVSVWQPAPEPPADAVDDDTNVTRRAWLIRAGRHAEDATQAWLEGGFCAIGWGETGAIPSASTRKDIAAMVEAAYPDRPPGWIRSSVGNIDRFINRVRPGDLVVTPHGKDVFVGVITSDTYWPPAAPERRRSVDWANPDAPLDRSSLSDSAFSKMRTLLTVSDVSENLAEFARRVGIDVKVPIASERVDTTAGEDLVLERVDDAFAAGLHVPAEWLNDIIDLLEEKRQIILYGPPGTGKTYLAQQLADRLTGAEASTLVQFHPSYAYEDFFEGFRPQESPDSKGIDFELVPGPLRRIADAAREDQTQPYILIIDEINRANLAKVFGELYFLLEYRDRSIALQYGGESEFSIPKNLFVIGTMNTADRSIAFVDAAMRRRFYFVPFFPRLEPISKVLRRWLEAHSMDDRPARILDALNDRIDDDDFAVGPSYLMTERVGTDEGLERIWRHAIMPLLEEHFFGTGRDVASEFGLAGLQGTLSSQLPPDTETSTPVE